MQPAIMGARGGRVCPSVRRLKPSFAWLSALALLLQFGFAAGPAAAAKGRLNDTGQTLCVNEASKAPIECAGSAQDGESGRDVTANHRNDGKAGFSYIKISASGAELPASATNWSCVKDKVSGLMWEVKTNDGGLRDRNNSYTNWGDGRAGDASAFVTSVNATGLCGYQDWRLPSRMELQGLVDYGKPHPGPTINSAWFPNTNAWPYWSGSGFADAAKPGYYSWVVDFRYGEVSFKYHSFYAAVAVRLVRAGQ